MVARVAIRRLLTDSVLLAHTGDDAGASDLRDASHTNGCDAEVKTDTEQAVIVNSACRMDDEPRYASVQRH
ncbi:hypothetical protein GCM10027271_48180 [Saccharopolyspora gloriosae]